LLDAFLTPVLFFKFGRMPLERLRSLRAQPASSTEPETKTPVLESY